MKTLACAKIPILATLLSLIQPLFRIMMSILMAIQWSIDGLKTFGPEDR